MPQKIKITKLVKTDEYIQKELDSIKSIKLRLLRDSDWTQLMDTPMSKSDILKWRRWRTDVRNIDITKTNMLSSKDDLLNLEKYKPQSTIVKIKRK